MYYIIEGNEVSNTGAKATQVYMVTHDGAGNRLPYMNRSFISFSYGGKIIEDFGLIVTTNDKISRNIYASFSDSTTNYDVLDGQLYWGSHFEANKLSLTLSTDEMSEYQLDQFREWFAPGVERELILSEHPNRAILARVSSSPTTSFLPFEKQTSIKINGVEYSTSTTIYKGDITIEFVMDDPYWYSKLNYMPIYIDKMTLDKLELNSVNVNKIETLTDKDMIKIMIEDGIPHQSILTEAMFLGGNLLVRAGALVAPDENADPTKYALTDVSYLDMISIDSEGLTVNSNNNAYLFYSGTAKSYPIIKFSMNLQFDNDGFISNPRNKIQDSALTDYSKIIVGDKTFEFTTSSLLTGYNQAREIFSNADEDATKPELLEKLRETINEHYSRAWAVKCLDVMDDKTIGDYENNGSNITIRTRLLSHLRDFFQNSSTVTFIINSKTGEAVGKFNINTSVTLNGGVYSDVEESVGDMIRSDYLIIEGKNSLDQDGYIDLTKCKQISSNENLTNVLIFYRNMYL